MSIILKRQVAKIHVYSGGTDAYQLVPFQKALERIEEQHFWCELHVTYLYKKHLSKRFKPKDLIDWLLDCDYHFILTHTHQAIEHFNCNEVVNELQRLRNHPGFPSGDELQCPIFLQDKRVYIEGMLSYSPKIHTSYSSNFFLKTLQASRHSIPSFFVSLPFQANDEDLVQSLQVFVSENSTPGVGPLFVCKLPFVTNCEGLKFPNSFDSILNELRTASRKYMSRIPYAIIQPRLSNMKEKKLILLNGRFHHFAVNHRNVVGREYADDSMLPPVAERYLQELTAACPGTIASGLVRVDLMCYNGNIVVNEFESLEAMYEPEKTNRIKDPAFATKQYLITYWHNILEARVLDPLDKNA